MDVDKKMPDSCDDWLNECPVNWIRISVNSETVHYSFATPDTDDD